MSQSDSKKPQLIRINKYLSICGVASRRGAEKLIRQGRVKINGVTVEELGTRIDERNDVVNFDGVAVRPVRRKVCVLLNKPRQVITSMSDPSGRPTVTLLLADLSVRVYPVGRLDYDTEGVLLLTNEGELAYRLTHPRYQTPKIYEAIVVGDFTRSDGERIEAGIELDDGVTGRASVSILGNERQTTHIKLKLTEGRKREVRQLCEAVGHPVRRLCRTKFAGISAHGMKLGAWRYLSSAEVGRLRSLVGL
ncbi:MAG: pseudouridine synthase [candidate division Zixibacteria bacterium]|nr:pseudouridine synthase [candidate division Zixibacteria bacterium]